MLLDLKSPLKQGDKVPVTLEFEKAGKVTALARRAGRRRAGARGAGASSGGHMEMKKMPDHSGMKN